MESDSPLSDVTDRNVVVVGGIGMDYVGRAQTLPGPGGSSEGDAFTIQPGGKGANGAVAAARLGARTALVGCVGEDEPGAHVLHHLRGEQVDIRFVQQEEQAATGATVIQVDAGGEKQTVSRPGSNHHLTAEDVRRAGSAFAEAAVLLVQLEVPAACVEEAIRHAHDVGAQVVLDPAPVHAFPEDLLSYVDVITPNAQEAEELTGVAVEGRSSARRAAERLLERGAGAVAVQAGGEGNLLMWPDGTVWMPMLPIDVVDTTGAGDAFAAGFAVQMAEGHSPAESARFAHVCAGLAATELGAQAALPRRETVLETKTKHRVR